MEHKSPVFGTASAALAVLTVLVLAAAVALFANAGSQPPAGESTAEANRRGWDNLGELVAALVGLLIAVAAAGVAAFSGVVAGVVALARGERARWRAVVGLVVCGGFVALLLVLLLNGKSG